MGNRLNYYISFGSALLLSSIFGAALYLNIREEERSKRDEEAIERIFERFDSNQNGVLEREEYY